MEHNSGEANDFIEAALSRRSIPRADPDLAERIIHRALMWTADQKIQGEEGGKSSFWGDISSMFVFPHPSYVLVAGVFMGLALGLLTGQALLPFSDALGAFDMVSFLDVNEGVWL